MIASPALPWPLWLAAVFGTVTGAAIGSFLGALLVRWPEGRSIAAGRSVCDACGRRLAWFELVPIAACVHLRGRCRTCGTAIDPVQPALEIICALIGAAAFAADVPLLAPLGWLLAGLALFDLRHFWLPNPLVAALGVAALLAPPPVPEVGWPLRLAGGLAGFAVLYALAAIYRRLRRREGLGGGDAKLLGALGLWTGLLALPTLLLIACAVGFGDVAMRYARGQATGTMKLPLGAYLALAVPVLLIMPL